MSESQVQEKPENGLPLSRRLFFPEASLGEFSIFLPSSPDKSPGGAALFISFPDIPKPDSYTSSLRRWAFLSDAKVHRESDKIPQR
uniref:Uncharacterized protein n=1 Tax=Thermosporothrix sp. COM3 TaxID=2490863 RepID=A0A455SJY3_9CHLR|nr:hypothetical protein KTC_26810 [Thermosporothrix sp. COM3]